MPIITVDGNIGAGKSSILNFLHKNHNVYVDLEPIDKWKTFLDNIYNNKTNFFNFQIRVWLDRSWIQEKDKTSVILMERSPYFIRNTFNKYSYDNDYVNKNEYTIINELYDKTDIIWKSNYYIYIRSSPKKCLERILKRGRDNEMNISLEYLKEIHDLHENSYNEAVKNNFNIIVIDIENKSFEEIAFIINNFIKNINLKNDSL